MTTTATQTEARPLLDEGVQPRGRGGVSGSQIRLPKMGRPRKGAVKRERVVTASFSLPPALLERARAAAEARGVSFSRYISELVMGAIEDQ